MADDPFALFDAWFAEAKAAEPNDPEAMALATAGARRAAVGADGAAEGPRRSTASSSTPISTAARARSSPPIRSAALLFHWKSLRRQVRIEGPVEPVARGRGRRLFRDPRPRFAARRLGVGPVAAARQPRDVRGALRGDDAAVRGRATCPARRAGRGYRLVARADRILERPRRTGCTSAACSPATATAAGAKGCSTHERGHHHAPSRARHERGELTSARPWPASPWRCSWSR